MAAVAFAAALHPASTAALQEEIAEVEAALQGGGSLRLLKQSLNFGEGCIQMGVLGGQPKALEVARALAEQWPRDVEAISALAVGLAREGSRGAREEAATFFDAANALPPPSLTRFAATRPGNLEALAGLLASPDADDGAKGNDSEDEGADDGGWGVGSCAASCEVERRGLDLGLDEFEERYARGGRPVVLPLAAVVGAEANTSAWQRDELLRAYGDAPVPVQRTADVTERQLLEAGRGGGGAVAREDVMSLGAFAKLHMAPSAPLEEGGGARYVFSTKALPELLEATAAALKGGPLGRSAEFLGTQHIKKLLSLGPAGSGTFFHAHSNALFLLHHGCKRWLILPPAATFSKNATGGGGTRDWIREAADESLYPMKPLECVTRSGEAMFVPSGWRHLVVNERHSVGIALEVGDNSMIAAFTK